tara:strand:+ start:67491 stop:67760 length:270 start_codon:yes stop_codon:yes gene_type:complete
MTSTRQLEKNTRIAFELARQDISALYDHVSRLHHVVLALNQKVGGEVFVASKTAKKYHTKTCVFAKKINHKNKLTFTSKPKGLKACKCV